MNIKEQFEKILKNKTRDEFHDSGLVELRINFEAKELSIKIEHWKDGAKEGEEKIYSGIFLFRDVSNIHLDNKVNCFIKEEEISSFDIKEDGEDYIFLMTGIKGWVFSFSAISFDYKEIFKELYTYS